MYFSSGYVQTSGEWPFTSHFFTENQLNRFVEYCKSEKYSYLHVDATGSVVKKPKNQNAVYFYSMVFKPTAGDSSILPLSSALLCDQSAGAITSYFNCVLGKLALRSKTARPSFVVIDFSAALLNSALSSFNVENINNHLRRCSNTLAGAYTASQLRSMTFIRLCCSHVMKAFARSLYKIENSKEARRRLMSLFATLLNSNTVDGAFDLYEQIMNIYADPYAEHSSRKLSSLLDTIDPTDDEIGKYLDDEIGKYLDDNNHTEEPPHFVDEIDITKDAIIHQSPFNVKARARIPVLARLIRKGVVTPPSTNSLYSPKIVQLLYKWFAYLPLWSCVMADFVDR